MYAPNTRPSRYGIRSGHLGLRHRLILVGTAAVVLVAAIAAATFYFTYEPTTLTVAVGPGGGFFFNTAIDSIEESARRNLESCGAIAGVPCMIVAVDDVFVVPIPTTLHPLGFFKAAESPVIAPGERDEVARKLNEASSG